MTDSLKKRGNALEEDYFRKQQEEALKKIAEGKRKQKNSPITGKPMKITAYSGVEIDVCEESGGVWLDKGELEKIIEAAKNEGNKDGWADSLLKSIGLSKD